jgi:two-component system, NarL family, response regulator DevR
LLLADSHEIARAGVRTMLDQARHIEIIGEAGTVTTAVEEARRFRPDVMLIELRLRDGRGIDVFRHIHEVSPDTRLLVLTYSTDDESIISALRFGVHGFVLKTVTMPALVQAVETVAAGQLLLDPSIASKLVAYIRNQPASIHENNQRALSTQEHRVMELVAQGKTNKEIASALGLSDRTIKNYLSHVYEKLQVTRRAHATKLFVERTRTLTTVGLADFSCPS